MNADHMMLNLFQSSAAPQTKTEVCRTRGDNPAVHRAETEQSSGQLELLPLKGYPREAI